MTILKDNENITPEKTCLIIETPEMFKTEKTQKIIEENTEEEIANDAIRIDQPK